MRNFLATLMLSQGVPMLAGGDEVARSQMGNNNCYCQDNELTWMDWNLDERRERLREFTCRIIQLRLAHPNLHRRKFFQDREVRRRSDGSLVLLEKDAAWFNPDGNEVSDEAWNAEWTRAIALLLNGCTLQVSDEDGDPGHRRQLSAAGECSRSRGGVHDSAISERQGLAADRRHGKS